jgi:hypothetical protein
MRMKGRSRVFACIFSVSIPRFLTFFFLSTVSVERYPGFGSFASGSPCLAGIVVLPPARREPTPRRDRGQSMMWVISHPGCGLLPTRTPSRGLRNKKEKYSGQDLLPSLQGLESPSLRLPARRAYSSERA